MRCNKCFLLVVNSPLHFLCRIQILWTRRLEKSHSCKWHITIDLPGNRQESSFSDPCTHIIGEGIIFFCSPLFLDQRQRIVLWHRKLPLWNTKKNPPESFCRIFLSLPWCFKGGKKDTWLFLRAKFPGVPCKIGNLLVALLPSGTRLPWTSELLWPSLRMDKQLHTWPGTKKDTIELFLRRTMLEFSLSDNFPSNNCKWKLEAKDFSLYLVIVLLHSLTLLMVGLGDMLFKFVQEAMQKPNTISAA